MPRRKEDESLNVQFETRAVRNKARSDGEIIRNNDNEVVHEIKGSGQDEFDNVAYVQIDIPGDKDSIALRPATFCGGPAKMDDPAAWTGRCKAPTDSRGRPRLDECDVHRFPDEWAAYKAGQAAQLKGTPIKSLPGIDPASLEELAYHKIFTIEVLAALNDSNATRFFGLRQRARDYLDAANKTTNVRAELDAKDKQLAAMQEQINQLLAVQKGEKQPPKEKRP